MKISSKFAGAGLAAISAVSLCAMSVPASATSMTQAGEIAGYTWAPLPQGLYFATTESYGNWRGLADNAEAAVSIPVIVWSTPWTLFGGRIESYVAVPSLSVTAPHYSPAAGTVHVSGFALPAGFVGEAWDLGNGWGISEFVGGYAPSNNDLSAGYGNLDHWTFNNRFGVTWAQNGWSLTAHVTYGVTGNNLSSSSGFYGLKNDPNYVNLDLTGTYTLGKWSLGAVAFGSWDVSGISFVPGVTPATGYAKQSQFAVGPFVGYNFGPVILQAWVTRDVSTHNYFDAFGNKDYETRGWMRVIVPLWAPAPPAPVVAKY